MLVESIKMNSSVPRKQQKRSKNNNSKNNSKQSFNAKCPYFYKRNTNTAEEHIIKRLI